MMLTQEEKDHVTDYFETWELAEFLRLAMEDFIDAFEDEIENKINELNEIMGTVTREEDDETSGI